MRQKEWFVKKHEPGLDERFKPIEMIYDSNSPKSTIMIVLFCL